MRYERKYRIDASSFDQILHCIRMNPMDFKWSYPKRIVNSIYYDDINYSAYNDNLSGISNRIKYRIRWYGDNMVEIKKPVLEKKIKQNMLGTKEHFSLSNFSLSDCMPDINQEVNLTSNQLFPATIVRYERTYLESFDKKIRATIDQNLCYYNISNGKVRNPKTEDSALILEIKYDRQHADYADKCLQSIPFRLTKNSKYVSAIECFF